MNYSPKHNDTKMRGIYFALIAIGLASTTIGAGLVKTIFTALSLVFIATGLYLFIRHDLTTYTYIVMDNGGRADFYVDRAVGKRGAYVCYYPLSDAVLLCEYKKGVKKELSERYGKVFVYNYCHNRLCGKKQAIVFQNDGYYDAVIMELDSQCLEYLKSCMAASKQEC